MRPLNQDLEQLGSEPPTMGAVENAADEANILADQDETNMTDLSANDENIGSDGTEEFGLDSAEFARGEIDLKELMDRSVAAQDALVGHPREHDITPHSQEGEVEAEPSVQRANSESRPVKSGHETGAYTDVGAGRSGVTRTKH